MRALATMLTSWPELMFLYPLLRMRVCLQKHLSCTQLPGFWHRISICSGLNWPRAFTFVCFCIQINNVYSICLRWKEKSYLACSLPYGHQSDHQERCVTHSRCLKVFVDFFFPFGSCLSVCFSFPFFLSLPLLSTCGPTFISRLRKCQTDLRNSWASPLHWSHGNFPGWLNKANI